MQNIKLIVLLGILSSLGCTPDEGPQQPSSDSQLAWAGKYRSHVKQFEYCDGVTSPGSSQGTEEVIIGEKPFPYFLAAGFYRTIVTQDTNLLVAEDRTEVREDTSDKSKYYLMDRYTLSKDRALFEFSLFSVDVAPPEPGLDVPPSRCEIGGNVFIGELIKLDGKNRSCKDLEPPCPRPFK